jgi:ADP-ribose pyrophosphatase YjhB (NUDIX family)
VVTEQARAVPRLLDWARRLQAIAQTGLAYDGTRVYDSERYEQVRQIAAEMFASDGDSEAADSVLALEAGHATPKLDVRGVVFRDGEILLVRENGAWGLPGGWVDVGESPSEAAVREVLEESGYETRAVRLLGLLDRDRHSYEPHAWHIWKAIVLCELAGDERRPLQSETDEAAFFARDAIPGPLRSGAATRAMIDRAFEQQEHPEWPADFD